MKRCPRCSQVKPRSEFYSSYCKPCQKAYTLEWVRANPDQFRRTQRRSVLWRKYGLTEEDLDEMLSAQRGKCAICRAPVGAGTLNVDHDHATGRVRGILCGRCNKGIGLLRDNSAVIRSAITYLNRRNGQTGTIF